MRMNSSYFSVEVYLCFVKDQLLISEAFRLSRSDTCVCLDLLFVDKTYTYKYLHIGLGDTDI